MTRGHVLSVSLVLVALLFTGVATLRIDVPERAAVSSCCGGDCCCPPGQCACCEGGSDGDHSDVTLLDKEQSGGTTSFWRSLACTGHTTVLFHSEYDPYTLGSGSIALFDGVCSGREEPNIPAIRDILILPPDKVPRLLS